MGLNTMLSIFSHTQEPQGVRRRTAFKGGQPSKEASPGKFIMPVSSMPGSAAASFIPSNLHSEQWGTQWHDFFEP